MSSSKQSAQTMALTKDKLEQLASDPSRTVYQWEYDTPDAQMEAETARDTFVKVCQAFDAGCRKYPTASDEALRESVMKTVPDARLFQHLYASVFARAAVRVHSPAQEELLDRYRKMTGLMLSTRCEHKSASEEDKASLAMQLALRFAMKPTEPGKIPEDAVNLDDQLLAAGVDPSEATPVGRFDLGPSTVNQV